MWYKKSIRVIIDSRNRDKILYPDPHHYMIKIEYEHSDVMSIELTQANIAEAVQVSRKSINAIENGVYIPSTVLALKIATVLNCTVEEIFKLHDGTFPLLMRSNKYE